MMVRRALTALVLSSLLASRAHADGLAGTVSDVTTAAPIADATVVITGGTLAAPIAVKTDADGEFSAAIPAGTYAVLMTFGTARQTFTEVVVSPAETRRLDAFLEVTEGVEVRTIRETMPVTQPQLTRDSGLVAPPYSDEAILANDWRVAWLLLDIDARGSVVSFKFLHRPGLGLDELARRQAFRLRFVPALDAAGHPTSSRRLHKMEWPAYWKTELHSGSGDVASGQHVRCRGTGPLNLDNQVAVYKDCSRPDFTAERREPLIRPSEGDTAAAIAAEKQAIARDVADCDRGDAEVCADLASRYEAGRTVPRDLQRARELEEKACHLGSAAACANLGASLVDGRAPRDVARAQKLFARACKAGEERACRLAAARDPAAMQEIVADLVCAQGDPRACYNLALKIGRANMVRTSLLYDQACTGGVALGCSNLGLLLEKDDPERAAALYRRACDGGAAIGCSNLGHALMSGTGVAKDPAAARVVLERACQSGEATGCFNLSILVEWGLGGPRDPARAKELARRACAAGERKACVRTPAQR